MCSQSVKIAYFCVVAVLVATVEAKNKDSKPNPLNGDTIDIKEISYLVQLRDYGGKYFCSGTVVTNKHVVTLSKCVDAKKPASISVAPETNDPSVEPKYTVGVSKYTPVGNDITVLTLITELKESTMILELPKPVTLKSKYDFVVIGWSITTQNAEIHSASKTPIALARKMRFGNECSKQMPVTSFCAGVPRKMATACGDRGSPAFYDNQWVGISKGYGSELSKDIEEYVQVIPILDNIKRVTGLQ